MSVSMGRANKPLGWFLADDIVEKMGASLKVDGSKTPEDKKRRRGARRGSKKSIDLMSNQTPSEGSVASDDLFDEKQSVQKDDYWFYDVASDGYYYEQNGAKGWRRRMPNSALQKIKEQEMAQLAANGKTAPLSPQVQAAAQAALLQSALFNPPALNSRYYDPGSDGFFYEMASVDGWKRRQPAPRPSLTRASPGSSYGAALARGQLPRTSIIDDSSASSSVSEDTISTDPFGTEAGFSLPDSFGLSRPDSLNFAQDTTMLPGFNPEKFIQDLSFSGLDANKMMALSARTPADSWATRCHNWTISKEAPISPEEESMGLLLKGLENIWSSPTPVKNL